MNVSMRRLRETRSAAAGIWVFSVGVAPVGQLCLGVLAMVLGVRWALASFAVAGLLVTGTLGGLARQRGELGRDRKPSVASR